VPFFNSAVEPELAALRPADVRHQTARFVLDANVLDDIAGTAAHLAACGLLVDRLLGDWDESPFDERTSREMIFVARPV